MTSTNNNKLPIYEKKQQILNSLNNYSTLIISGPIKSGKSTQIPQYLIENGTFKTIAVTQPKRNSAINLAERVSFEINTGKDGLVGKTVGYGIRFEEKVSEETRIKYMTDGLLIREMMLDPLLSKYSIIMIDEVQERTLPTDILMALLKQIQKKRSDLKIIISTNNLNGTNELFNYFNHQTTDSSKDSCFILKVQSESSSSSSSTIEGDSKQPEIQKSNLLSVTLQLKALGVNNLLDFDFLTSPSSTILVNAIETLTELGALDKNDSKLTPDGTIMVGIPVEPSFSKMIIQSQQFNCSEEIITIVAMLSTPNLFNIDNNGSNSSHEQFRKDLIVKEGDHLTLLNIFNTFVANDPSTSQWSEKHQINYQSMQRVLQTREQLLTYVNKLSIKLSSCLKDQNSDISIRKSIISGSISNIAQLQSNGSYQTIKDKSQTLWLSPSSILSLSSNLPQYVVFNDKITETNTNKVYMNVVSSIDSNWLN